ncbi:hypothetical protein [Arthrobacter sp. Z4-13]
MPQRERATLIGALLACLLVGGPAAHATFTAAATTAMKASTLALAAPTGNSISANCSPIGQSGKSRLSITVNSHGTVPRATNYVLKLVDPSGAIQTIDLIAGKAIYDSGPSTGVSQGIWKYSIEAQYRVPGTTNVWTSAAAPSPVTC